MPTCLILSDKHIRGVSTETGPDVRLDRLPSENDEIRRRQQTPSGRSLVIRDVLWSALKENVYNL